MTHKIGDKNRKAIQKQIFIILNLLLIFSLFGCEQPNRPEAKVPEKAHIKVSESWYSRDLGKISIGISNIQNHVSPTGTASIDKNKHKILNVIDEFKKYKVNMILFPEFSLTGYFWENSPECWNYMREGLTNNQLEWLAEVKSKLDADLNFIIFNNIRLNPDKPDGKFLNSTFIINKDFDMAKLNSQKNEQSYIYDKTFLPGIEKTFTTSGKVDSLVLDTKWGRFGFTTCYDMSFPQIYQEYAMFDKVDAIIELASWRGTSTREYSAMNVRSDHYYGFIWDLMASSQAAFNQIWIIACNAVGKQKRGDYEFWGGSGVWAPSGMNLVQGAHVSEELIVIHHVDIKGQTKFEYEDFHYYKDFIEIYNPIIDKRAYTRTSEKNKG
ncbi:MAG: carbon-nitrogen hydrolase family protein [Thermodesulfobacteriota bacterium]|nr:carbon-nitrogen hydrolase family protein [Thermodesulfobacteriota bacterium]